MAYDISLIRPELRAEQIKSRGQGFSLERRAAIKRGLRTLHALEIMATNIYRCQISRPPCELNVQLTTAMCNEMTHMQDFQTTLFEYGFSPSKTRWVYWMAGYGLGLGSRLLGTQRILRTGVWAEKKAVAHYEHLLDSIDWDEETRAVIEKNHADEFGHVERWETLLRAPGTVC